MSIIRAKTLDLKVTKPLTEKQSANSRLNEKEALDGVVRLSSYPRRLVLEMTSACNIRCKMCGRSATDFKSTVFDKKWLDIFKPITESIEEITLFGWGEPTLHPNFKDFLKFAHENKLRKYFCTNGLKLDELQESIFENEVDLLTISLDGANSKTNNSIRCGADFDKIISNVKGIVKERQHRGVEYPYLSFVMTVMQSNYRELPDYVRLAHECGIEEIKGVYLTIFDENVSDELMYNMKDELALVFAETERLGDELGIAVKLPHLQGEDIAGEKAHKDCYVGWRDFFLGSDGYVRSCMSTPVKLFNVEKYISFDEMWNSSEYIEFRNSVNTNSMNQACQNCYQASTANWNRKPAFDQRGNNFAPEWD